MTLKTVITHVSDERLEELLADDSGRPFRNGAEQGDHDAAPTNRVLGARPGLRR